jgi:SAM-dependent methyltransferase
MDQRRDYLPLPNAADDERSPWFLYWEIFWVLHVTRPFLKPGARLLDAGGASSLFSCYLGSLGYHVDTVDLNEKLITNNNRVAEQMQWNSRAHTMNLAQLEFPDNTFDHVYSICVFEHLDHPLKLAAIREIARCLKPGGFFAVTFDYRNPAPGVLGVGKDPRPINQLSTPADLARTFLSDPRLELFGNPEFFDSGTSYLSHPMFNYAPYTFGALFMRKK